jgi:hypothetical protein
MKKIMQPSRNEKRTESPRLLVVPQQLSGSRSYFTLRRSIEAFDERRPPSAKRLDLAVRLKRSIGISGMKYRSALC